MTANFGKYFTFILRRERIVGGIWVIALTAFSAMIVAMYPGLFPTVESMQGMVITMNTPAMVALMGPVYGLEGMTTAIVMAQECLIWLAIAVIIMNIFFINRYTRVDEELGRFEMIASLPVGRLANSAAAIFFAFVLNLVVAVLIGVFTVVIPLEGATVAGGFAYGLSIGMQGFVFAAVTLLTAQLFSTARGSMGVSFAVMGVAYIMRAQGDIAGNVLSYLSPMGLGLKVEAFYANDFTPVIALFVEGAVIAAIALWIHSKRDIGAGVFPARKGRAHASRFLGTPLGLAWRLMRNGFAAWAVGILVMGMTYGAVVGELDNFVKGNDIILQMLQSAGGTGSMVDAFVAMLNGIMSLIMSVPLVNCVLRLYSEEKRGRLEPVLAAAVPRGKLFGSFAVIALAEAAVFPLIGVIGFYAASQSTGMVSFAVLLQASYVYLPAMLVMVGLTALLTGILPKLSALIWALFGYGFVMFYFGRMFTEIPDWAVKVSPFGNVPQLPVEEFTVMPIAVLGVLAVAFGAAGLFGYCRRDSGR